MGRLKVLTLNIAHGRRLGFHQALLPRRILEDNLQRIAEVLRREEPDVVALQEADGPSSWSGRFDHVETLTRLAGFHESYRGSHSFSRLQLFCGTALLAKEPLRDTESVPFEQSWRDNKGFVVGCLPTAFGEIDVVSVHLDFLNPAMRRKQVWALADRLEHRKRPMMILGDFNCDTRSEDCFGFLTRTLGLAAFEPKAAAPTFPSRRPRARLDWILISRDLEFVSHKTLPDHLSDHLAVTAEIAPLAESARLRARG
jgi:endonuclease/exonuclease/phosphatase family metal-dependent hydrolase